MSRVLWDTSVLVTAHADSDDEVAISIVSVLELAAGVNAARDSVSRAARLAVYSSAVTLFRPLPLDGAVAASYIAIDAAVRAVGRRPDSRSADLQIAATAMAHGLPLVTRNPGDFAGLDDLLTVVVAPT